jgi:hypothetical protein
LFFSSYLYNFNNSKEDFSKEHRDAEDDELILEFSDNCNQLKKSDFKEQSKNATSLLKMKK